MAQTLPLLYAVARQVLAVPATSCDPCPHPTHHTQASKPNLLTEIFKYVSVHDLDASTGDKAIHPSSLMALSLISKLCTLLQSDGRLRK